MSDCFVNKDEHFYFNFFTRNKESETRKRDQQRSPCSQAFQPMEKPERRDFNKVWSLERRLSVCCPSLALYVVKAVVFIAQFVLPTNCLKEFPCEEVVRLFFECLWVLDGGKMISLDGVGILGGGGGGGGLICLKRRDLGRSHGVCFLKWRYGRPLCAKPVEDESVPVPISAAELSRVAGNAEALERGRWNRESNALPSEFCFSDSMFSIVIDK